MGRPPLSKLKSKKPGTFVGVTIPPETLRQLDAYARATRAKGRDPSRPAAVRALIDRGLTDWNREIEKEFG